MKSTLSTLFVIVALCFCNSQVMIAQWSTNPNVNNAICTLASDQAYPAMTSDGNGGAIIAWEDYRGGNADIYAQRISADGNVQWTSGGVPICTATGDQSWPTITSDGNGGAIITWQDKRSGISDVNIYAQRISADSIIQWNVNGVAICTEARSQTFPTIINDGSGGAIIAWQDGRLTGGPGIYTQRINAVGTLQWSENGVALCAVCGLQGYQTQSIVSDGSGGAIVAWQDGRSQTETDIYAQRIDSAGTIRWTTDGVTICTAIYDQTSPILVSDGGGAFITWKDRRSGNWHIYAQRINADSIVQWTAQGITVCNATGDQVEPAIMSDVSGGAIVTWGDNRSGNYDIYAQRISADSTMQWTANGIAVCTVAGGQEYPIPVSDGSGGAIIKWWDYSNASNSNIYAQRINASGTLQWSVTGVAISTATGYQGDEIIVSDGNGGAIIAWDDQRSGNYDIYAQRIFSSGNLYTGVTADGEVIPETFSLAQNYPNPFNPSTTFHFALPTFGNVKLVVLNILGQEVAEVINQQLPAGTYDFQWNANNLSSGVYFYKLTTNQFSYVRKMMLLK